MRPGFADVQSSDVKLPHTRADKQVESPVKWIYPEISLLQPSGFFTYHQSKILHGARFALSVFYGSQNKERLLLYTSLADWFL
jgi:hypothetical protein